MSRAKRILNEMSDGHGVDRWEGFDINAKSDIREKAMDGMIWYLDRMLDHRDENDPDYLECKQELHDIEATQSLTAEQFARVAYHLVAVIGDYPGSGKEEDEDTYDELQCYEEIANDLFAAAGLEDRSDDFQKSYHEYMNGEDDEEEE